VDPALLGSDEGDGADGPFQDMTMANAAEQNDDPGALSVPAEANGWSRTMNVMKAMCENAGTPISSATATLLSLFAWPTTYIRKTPEQDASWLLDGVDCALRPYL
jgi:hypothetical protein